MAVLQVLHTLQTPLFPHKAVKSQYNETYINSMILAMSWQVDSFWFFPVGFLLLGLLSIYHFRSTTADLLLALERISLIFKQPKYLDI